MPNTPIAGNYRNIVSAYTANEPRFIKHERVEFLERLSTLDDPMLREMGLRGIAEIKAGDRLFTQH